MSTLPSNLEWFKSLLQPFRGLELQGSRRVLQLLELRLACDQCGLPYDKTNPEYLRYAAYQLAQEFPHFDRDLTAFYLNTSMHSPPCVEYELYVAHSIMRLHAPATHLELIDNHFRGQNGRTWRSLGLLHVLAVAAINMPDLASDWFHVSPELVADPTSEQLAVCLNHLTTKPLGHKEAIEKFIQAIQLESAGPAALVIATTLDCLAKLMRVESTESNQGTLDGIEKNDNLASLSFQRLEDLATSETCSVEVPRTFLHDVSR